MKDSGREQSDCPVCGMQLNAHTNTVGYTPPKTGDYTICLFCQSVLRFGLFELRTLTDREQQIVARDKNIQKARAMVAEIHRRGEVEG